MTEYRKRFKTWTKLKGKVTKIRKKYYTYSLCPRIGFVTMRGKYRSFSYNFGDYYIFINKSHYDFRC